MQCRNPSWDFTMEINEVKEKIGLMDIIHNHLPKYEDEDEDEIDEYEAKEKIWTEINSILFGNFFDYICIYGAYLEETLLSETETWRRLCREYIWEKSDINKKLNTIEEEHYLKLKKLLEEFRNIHIFFKKNMNPSNPEGSEYKKSQQWLEKFKKEIHYTINTLNTI